MTPTTPSRAWRSHLAPLLLFAGALAGGCASATAIATDVQNPARTPSVESTQTYAVSPDPDDHVFEVALVGWRPNALSFAVRLINTAPCASADAYHYTLVDDQERSYAWHQTSTPATLEREGHLGARVYDVTFKGEFPIAVTPDTKHVVFQIRPSAGRPCTAVDFRWNLTGAP